MSDNPKIIPKLHSLFSKNFVILDESMTIEGVVSFVSRLNPEYIFISMMREGDSRRYVVQTEAFLDFVRKKQPPPGTQLGAFLKLDSYSEEKRVEVSIDPLKDPEAREEISKNLHRRDFLILEHAKHAIGLIDPQRGKRGAIYRLKGPSHQFSTILAPSSRDSLHRDRMAYLARMPEQRNTWRPPEVPSELRRKIIRPEKPRLGAFRVGDVGAPIRSQIEKLIELERYPRATLQAKVVLGQTIPLTVVIGRRRAEILSEGIRIDAHRIDRKVPVHVVVKPGTFRLEGEYFRILNVPVKAIDSEPAIFLLKAQEIGWQAVRIQFLQNGDPLGSLESKTMVVATEEQVGTPKLVTATGQLKLDQGPTQPDICIYICERKTEPDYEYDVIFQSDKFDMPWKKMGPIRFAGNPETKFQAIFKDMERDDLPADVVEESIRSKGIVLWEELIPSELKELYWKIRDRVKSIRVISDEPWVPWEILRPSRNLDDKSEEDDFLCERYSFSRWLEHRPLRRKERLTNGRLVVPSDTGLKQAEAEHDWLLSFAQGLGLEMSEMSSFQDVVHNLKTGGFDLLHVSTHGAYNQDHPYLSEILLESKMPLRPENISGVATMFGRTNPFVILNACQTGAQGFSLTGIGSWATRFLDAGASGFIGTLWSVSDDAAFAFTKGFYQQLDAGNTVGEAVRTARNSCRRAGDSSWLAYQLYAQPNSRIKLGKA